MELEPVEEPRLILSLDVDGVLEDASLGFSSTGLAGAAALRLLQLGGVGIVLNTARSVQDVRERVADLALLGGVAGFGAVTWDGVFQREQDLQGEPGRTQLARLRDVLRADESVVLDFGHRHCVRASRVADGNLAPLFGAACRRLLDELALPDVTYWVASRYADFAERRADKAAGLAGLQQTLGLQELPLAAIGDSACDIPVLRAAHLACVPLDTLEAYAPPRQQRFLRSRRPGADALWEMACRLVPAASLQRRVLNQAAAAVLPDWLPESLRRPPTVRPGLRPRLAAAFAGRR
jgi:3-deoxy-D-manno-octulosonate 8-phosphate phosphatase KdsC-like HAD superfamily phosphatase